MSDPRKVTIERTETDDEGTFGLLTTDTGWQCYTGELPWRDNEQGKSCIPAGTYPAVWRPSPKHGECYGVESVPGRTDIEIHSANWMGDQDKGKKCQLAGCIAPGRAIDTLVGQKATISSRDALAGLVEDLGKEPFILTIKWREGVGPVVQKEA